MDNTKPDPSKFDRKKEKKKDKLKQKETKRTLSSAALSFKDSEPKSTSRQQWKLWIKYSDLDLVPLVSIKMKRSSISGMKFCVSDSNTILLLKERFYLILRKIE
jgi:cytosine/uracil/thiamine/allantoin permease